MPDPRGNYEDPLRDDEGARARRASSEENPYSTPRSAPLGEASVSGLAFPWPEDVAHLMEAPPYRPGRGASLAARAMLCLTGAGSLIVAGAWVWWAILWQQVIEKRPVDGDAARTVELVVRHGPIAVIALFVFTGIPFCIWFHRKHDNLSALGADGLSYSSASAAWAFFVPLLNLFRPYQIGAEIWRASDPVYHPLDRFSWRSASAGTTTALWWALFLAPSFLERVVVGDKGGWDGPPETLRDRALMMAAIQVVSVAGAVVTVMLVQRVDRRQDTRHGLVAAYLAARAQGLADPQEPEPIPESPQPVAQHDVSGFQQRGRRAGFSRYRRR